MGAGPGSIGLAYEGTGLSTARTLAEQALAIGDTPDLGLLNAHMALAHVAVHRGDEVTAYKQLEQARRVFDRAGSYEQISDFAVPEWRMATFTSMLLSRMGDPAAVQAQDEADRTRPKTLTRFATHIQLHRALMLVNSGDSSEGVALARAAWQALPLQRRSQSLSPDAGRDHASGWCLHQPHIACGPAVSPQARPGAHADDVVTSPAR